MSTPDVLVPASPAPEPQPRRRRAVVLGAVGALLAGTIGAGAWAASHFLGGGGPQPADALPANTLAVVSLDLDPSLGQKVEALEVLRKFPSLRGKGTGGGDADARRFVWNAFDLGCEGTSFDDVASWLGDRAAVAGVPAQDGLAAVAVVEVTDKAKARAGARDLGCDRRGVAFVGDYLLLADEQATADSVAAAAGKGSLADSSTYRSWMDRAGGSGLVTAYIAQGAPEAWFRSISAVAEWEEEYEGFDECSSAEECTAREHGETVVEEEVTYAGRVGGDEDSDELFEELKKPYEDFEGMAATVRLDDGDVEAHLATRGFTGSAVMLPLPIGASGGRTAPADLPEDSAFAISSALAKGWAEDYFGMYLGFVMIAGQDTQPDWIADVEAMLGESVSLVVGPDVTAAQLDSPRAMKEAEAGIRIVGDPAKVVPLLRKYAAKDDEMTNLVIEQGDGVVAAGFNREYVVRLAKSGSLGDSDRYRDAVPEAGEAGTVLFADVDRLAAFLSEDQDIKPADLEPLETVGYSETTDGDDYVHGRLRVRTD